MFYKSIFILMVLAWAQWLMASNDHNHHHDEHSDAQESHIDEALAEKLGIVTARISPQTLNQSVTAYGSLAAGPEQLSHIRARFSGLIKAVNISIGDTVKQGDILAEVESNESLKNYYIRSPIDGVIIQRHANTGEVTQDQILFSVANFKTLWAELRIYPLQQTLVKQGQDVHFTVNNKNIMGKISHIIPALEKPYQVARIKLDNEALILSPGMLIEGDITTATFRVEKAVVKHAVHTMDGQPGIFIKDSNNKSRYVFQAVQQDRSDTTFVEIKSDVAIDTEYVSQNSYLIKADIEKSAAEHVH